MKKKYPFTDTFILNYTYNTATSGPDYIWENFERPGFALCVTPKNTKTFVYIYHVNGRKRYLRLGEYPYVTLKIAGEKYSEAFLLKKQGIDPSDYYDELYQKKKKAENEKRNLGTVKDLFECYYKKLTNSGKVSANEVRRALYFRALEPLGADTIANTVTSEDISKVLKKPYDEGKLVTTNRLRSYLLGAFKCGKKFDTAIDRGYSPIKFHIVKNPVENVDKPDDKEMPCKRNLKKKELKSLWDSLENAPVSPWYQNFVKLLLLTSGQRVKEVLHAKWSEINFKNKIWVLPSDRAKNDREHYIVLTKPAIQLLKDIKNYNVNVRKIKSDYLFPNPQDKHYSNEPTRIDMLALRNKKVYQHAKLKKFTPRDLRRTANTLMNKAGISEKSRKRIQNHARSDVEAIHYDFYKYKKEDRKAAKVWIKFLKNKVKLDI